MPNWFLCCIPKSAYGIRAVHSTNTNCFLAPSWEKNRAQKKKKKHHIVRFVWCFCSTGVPETRHIRRDVHLYDRAQKETAGWTTSNFETKLINVCQENLKSPRPMVSKVGQHWPSLPLDQCGKHDPSMHPLSQNRWDKRGWRERVISGDWQELSPLQGSHRNITEKIPDFSLIYPWPHNKFPWPIFTSDPFNGI